MKEEKWKSGKASKVKIRGGGRGRVGEGSGESSSSIQSGMFIVS